MSTGAGEINLESNKQAFATEQQQQGNSAIIADNDGSNKIKIP